MASFVLILYSNYSTSGIFLDLLKVIKELKKQKTKKTHPFSG